MLKPCRNAQGRQGSGGGVAARQSEHLVARPDQVLNDRRADEARSSRDENAHADLLIVLGSGLSARLEAKEVESHTGMTANTLASTALAPGGFLTTDHIEADVGMR
jgi:hypothetical protein